MSVAGSRSAPAFHWLVAAGNMCGNDINMIEMVSACSCASTASNLPLDAKAHFAQEIGASRPRLLPFCYPSYAFPRPNAASMIAAALSSLPWIRWP